MSNRSDYRLDRIEPDTGRHRFSADVNLDEAEQTSLRVVLRDALERAGVMMQHEEIISQPAGGVHPGSHLGVLVDLWRRLDACYHGRKTWNRGR